MHAMTSAGLFGKVTSLSTLISPVTELDYQGHVVRNGEKVCMSDFAIKGSGKFGDSERAAGRDVDVVRQDNHGAARGA